MTSDWLDAKRKPRNLTEAWQCATVLRDQVSKIRKQIQLSGHAANSHAEIRKDVACLMELLTQAFIANDSVQRCAESLNVTRELTILEIDLMDLEKVLTEQKGGEDNKTQTGRKEKVARSPGDGHKSTGSRAASLLPTTSGSTEGQFVINKQV